MRRFVVCVGIAVLSAYLPEAASAQERLSSEPAVASPAVSMREAMLPVVGGGVLGFVGGAIIAEHSVRSSIACLWQVATLGASGGSFAGLVIAGYQPGNAAVAALGSGATGLLVGLLLESGDFEAGVILPAQLVLQFASALAIAHLLD